MSRPPLRVAAALALGLAAVLAAPVARAQATPAGLWKQFDDTTHRERSEVRIVENGGVFSGRIERIVDPARADAVCELCSGDAKDKPVLGLTIIRGVRQNATDPTVWDGGEILDPTNGKTYRLRLTARDGGKTLDVRGYIGMPLLGRTQTWVRAE